jgi:divalent metal cation (Fe/Co/Zn/Cd) transporter
MKKETIHLVLAVIGWAAFGLSFAFLGETFGSMLNAFACGLFLAGLLFRMEKPDANFNYKYYRHRNS